MIVYVTQSDGLEIVVCSFCGSKMYSAALTPDGVGVFITEHAIKHGTWRKEQVEP